MAKHLSVKKRHRQGLARNRRNRAVKSKIRSALKQFEAATEPAAKADALRQAVSVTDKAAAKNVIHRNKANRIKSRLARQGNKAPAQAES